MGHQVKCSHCFLSSAVKNQSTSWTINSKLIDREPEKKWLKRTWKKIFATIENRLDPFPFILFFWSFYWLDKRARIAFQSRKAATWFNGPTNTIHKTKTARKSAMSLEDTFHFIFNWTRTSIFQVSFLSLLFPLFRPRNNPELQA